MVLSYNTSASSNPLMGNVSLGGFLFIPGLYR